MRVIIAGSRNFNNYALLKFKCDHFLQNQKDITILSGRAKGADGLGERYAKERNYSLEIFPADWLRLGKIAGPLRNKQLADNADALILFWNGESKGSKNMLVQAKQKGLKIREIKLKTSYFSFGQEHIHTIGHQTFDKDIIVKITSDDPREDMFKLFENKWSFEYNELPGLTWFPRGVQDISHLIE